MIAPGVMGLALKNFSSLAPLCTHAWLLGFEPHYETGVEGFGDFSQRFY